MIRMNQNNRLVPFNWNESVIVTCNIKVECIVRKEKKGNINLAKEKLKCHLKLIVQAYA
jgi:hypothetical protein